MESGLGHDAYCRVARAHLITCSLCRSMTSTAAKDILNGGQGRYSWKEHRNENSNQTWKRREIWVKA
ncbi:hypothetical protein Ancab_018948 [Ancistrocladus abbreviatus]